MWAVMSMLIHSKKLWISHRGHEWFFIFIMQMNHGQKLHSLKRLFELYVKKLDIYKSDKRCVSLNRASDRFSGFSGLRNGDTSHDNSQKN